LKLLVKEMMALQGDGAATALYTVVGARKESDPSEKGIKFNMD
jgi:hypothetical protein